MPLHKNKLDEFKQPTITGRLLYIRTNGKTYTEEFRYRAKHLVVNTINSLVDKIYANDVVKIDIDIQENQTQQTNMATIKSGGKTEHLTNKKKIETINVHYEDNAIHLWINQDSLSYMSVEEAIALRNELNEALMTYVMKSDK